jgi:ABC-type sugar transport system ATPase subunit
MADLVQFDSIVKTFGGVTALDGVTLSIRQGEVHALVGENGAGKSTLGKVLAGIHRPDSGQVLIEGRPIRFHSPGDASRAGIGMVHQELAFCPDLSVAENLCLGRYPKRLGFWLDTRAMAVQARQHLAQIGAAMDVAQPMKNLSTAQEQLVQIASAVASGARILVFDEPTSSLSESESERLFSLIESLKARGVTMIYVTHRMTEVFRLADRVSVLRDGRFVGTLDRKDATQDGIVQMMIGRPLSEYFPQHLDVQPGPEVLSVEGLSSPGKFQDISFKVRAGEIVGLAGLVGAGRSEVARAVFGLDRLVRGKVEVGGEPLRLGRIRTAMRQGVALVPEDRKRQGLVLKLSGRLNFSMALLDRLSVLGFVSSRRERREAEDYFKRLAVKTPSIEAPVSAMSGGNQQKVVLAKWLARKSRVLIVDEPTRGVDVGAKAAIHALLDQLARQGLGILLISSELPEVLNLSTRILVMREGRLVGELPRAQATQASLMSLMAGVAQPITA